MKNESKKAVMKGVCYLAILSLMGWSMGSAIADDEGTTTPKPGTTPVITKDDVGLVADKTTTEPAKPVVAEDDVGLVADKTTTEPLKPVVAEDDTATDADTSDSKPAMDAQRAQQLATTYGVTETQVLTMRQTDKMGWGEIKNLLQISQRIVADSAGSETPITAEQALAQVVQERQSGMGIGQIANSHNVKLGDLKNEDKSGKSDAVEDIDRSDKPDKVARPDKPEKIARPDKPEKIARPDKPDKPDRPDNPGKGK